jgi:Protein of unknown function (DUF3987)
MMDRFLYSYPELRPTRHTDDEISATAELTVLKLYEKLADLKMPESEGESFPGTVPMTKEAWEVFKDLADELSEEAHALGFPRRLRGAWSKLEAYLARLSLILALSRVVEVDEKEQVEPRDVLDAWVLVDYFKGHARRVFTELCGADPMDLLSIALGELLKEGDGKWEGTATDLREELTKRTPRGVPSRPEELSKRVRALAARSAALDVKDGYRGKERVLRINSPKNTGGAVGAVGDLSPATYSTDSTDSNSEGSSENMATIMRIPSKTGLLSIGDQWEEV